MGLLLDFPRLVLFILCLPFLIELGLFRYVFKKPEWFLEFDVLWQLWRPLGEVEKTKEITFLRNLMTKRINVCSWEIVKFVLFQNLFILPYFLLLLLQAWLQDTLPQWPKILQL